MIRSATWAGASGISYTFEVLTIEHQPRHLPGVYALVRSSVDGGHLLYLAEARNLAKGLAEDERADVAIRLGADEVHLMAVLSGQKVRKRIEADLIARWRPPLNRELQPSRA